MRCGAYSSHPCAPARCNVAAGIGAGEVPEPAARHASAACPAVVPGPRRLGQRGLKGKLGRRLQRPSAAAAVRCSGHPLQRPSHFLTRTPTLIAPFRPAGRPCVCCSGKWSRASTSAPTRTTLTTSSSVSLPTRTCACTPWYAGHRFAVRTNAHTERREHPVRADSVPPCFSGTVAHRGGRGQQGAQGQGTSKARAHTALMPDTPFQPLPHLCPCSALCSAPS